MAPGMFNNDKKKVLDENPGMLNEFTGEEQLDWMISKYIIELVNLKREQGKNRNLTKAKEV